MTGLILPYGGKTPRIAADAFVAPTAVVIGDVEIGAGASIWFGCVLRGDVNAIRVGDGTNIQDGTIVHGNTEVEAHPARGYRTTIGSGVTVGHMALLHACTLEDGSFVGIKACLLDGATVGDREFLYVYDAANARVIAFQRLIWRASSGPRRPR